MCIFCMCCFLGTLIIKCDAIQQNHIEHACDKKNFQYDYLYNMTTTTIRNLTLKEDKFLRKIQSDAINFYLLVNT